MLHVNYFFNFLIILFQNDAFEMNEEWTWHFWEKKSSWCSKEIVHIKNSCEKE